MAYILFLLDSAAMEISLLCYTDYLIELRYKVNLGCPQNRRKKSKSSVKLRCVLSFFLSSSSSPEPQGHWLLSGYLLILLFSLCLSLSLSLFL